MKIQKNLVMSILIYVILLIVYNMLVFLIFNDFTNVFWISYCFTMLAFFVQFGALYLSVFKKADVETVFFGMPLASFSIYYLIAQICVGTIFMIFQRIGTTTPIIIQTLILAIFLVVAIIAIMARDSVQEINDQIKTKVVTHKSKVVGVDMLLESCTDVELKAKLRNLSETIKYSDPMSNEAVADVEFRIQQKVSELRIYCENGEYEEAKKTCQALEMLYVERNKVLLISK